MKKFKTLHITFLLIGFFAAARTSAFNSKTDSLIRLLSTSVPDTNKMIGMNSLALQFYNKGLFDSSRIYISELLAIGNRLLAKEKSPVCTTTISREIANAYNTAGFISEAEGDYGAAIKNYLKAVKLYQQINDEKGLATEFNNIGIVYKRQGDFFNARKQYEQSLKIRQRLNDSASIAKCYQNIANVDERQGDYPNALKNHLLSLRIRESLNDKAAMSVSYQCIGWVYHVQGDEDEALKNYFKALNLSRSINDEDGVAKCNANFGFIFQAQGKYDDAIQSYQANLDYLKKLGQKKGVGSALTNIGSVYLNMAQQEKDPTLRATYVDKAIENTMAGLHVSEEMHNKSSLPVSYLNMASIFQLQRKYPQAESYLRKSEEVSLKLDSKPFLRDTYKSLYQLDSAKGDFRSSFINAKKYIAYRDSVDNEETRKQTIRTQMSYEFEKKEAVELVEHKKELESIQIIAEEKERKQLVVIAAIGGGLVLVLMFAFYILRTLRVTRMQKSIIEEQRNLVAAQKDEMEFQKIKVEEHQKEIIDSITYAKRIQLSQLPTQSYIHNTLQRLNR